MKDNNQLSTGKNVTKNGTIKMLDRLRLTVKID